MKNHIAKHKHHYLRAGLVFCLLIVGYIVTITIQQHAVSYALTYDSHATILITGDYQGSTSATSTQHSFGTCAPQVGQLFTDSGWNLYDLRWCGIRQSGRSSRICTDSSRWVLRGELARNRQYHQWKCQL